MFDAPGVRRKAARWSTGTVSSHSVVIAGIGSKCVGRTNRYHCRLVARRMNLAIDLSAAAVLAVVAGSDHNDYSRINQGARGAANWVVLVRTDRGCSQTHVGDANVVLVFIQRIA